MHTVFSILLTVAIALQSALGCGCRSVFGQVAADHPHAQCKGCCGHDHDEHSRPQVPQPCKCQLKASVGSYISQPKSSLEKPDSLESFDRPALAETSLALSVIWAGQARTTVEPGRSLPLYLVHQLLLV
jgi:hypothetical protein